MALEIDPENLDVLLGLERCYGRLNDEAKAAEVRRRDRPADEPGGDRSRRASRPQRARSFKIDLITDGRAARRSVWNSPRLTPGGRPLVTVFLDGRVVWERNGDTGFAEFSATLRPGPASLEITAVSDAVTLGRITNLRRRSPLNRLSN